MAGRGADRQPVEGSVGDRHSSVGVHHERCVVGNSRVHQRHSPGNSRVRAPRDGDERRRQQTSDVLYVTAASIRSRRRSRPWTRARRFDAESESKLRSGPVRGLLDRQDVKLAPLHGRPLVPVRAGTSRVSLHARSCACRRRAPRERGWFKRGDSDRRFRWFRTGLVAPLRRTGRPAAHGQNYIQLNSIAAGGSIEGFFFTASSDRVSSPPVI